MGRYVYGWYRYVKYGFELTKLEFQNFPLCHSELFFPAFSSHFWSRPWLGTQCTKNLKHLCNYLFLRNMHLIIGREPRKMHNSNILIACNTLSSMHYLSIFFIVIKKKKKIFNHNLNTNVDSRYAIIYYKTSFNHIE